MRVLVVAFCLLVSVVTAQRGLRSPALKFRENQKATFEHVDNSRRLGARIVGGEDSVEGRYPYFTSLNFGSCLNTGLSSCASETDLFLEDLASGLNLGVSTSGFRCTTRCSNLDCCACCNGGDLTATSSGCGGTLIAENLILSAAHCYSPAVPEFSVPAEPRQVTIGIYNESNNAEVNEVFNVVEHVLHPGYNEETIENDFMILRIDGTSSFDPVVIDDGSCSEITVDSPLTVFGFGDLLPKGDSGDAEYEQQFPDVLQEVDVDYLTNKMCFEDHLYQFTADAHICNNMMCAYGDGEVDSCQGDSGGPLIVKGASADFDVQVGIVSWAIGCAAENYPGVYSRISNQFEFINETVAGMGQTLEPLVTKPLVCEGTAFQDPAKDFCYVGCSYPFECFRNAFIAAGVVAVFLLSVALYCCIKMCRRNKQQSKAEQPK